MALSIQKLKVVVLVFSLSGCTFSGMQNNSKTGNAEIKLHVWGVIPGMSYIQASTTLARHIRQQPVCKQTGQLKECIYPGVASRPLIFNFAHIPIKQATFHYRNNVLSTFEIILYYPANLIVTENHKSIPERLQSFYGKATQHPPGTYRWSSGNTYAVLSKIPADETNQATNQFRLHFGNISDER